MRLIDIYPIKVLVAAGIAARDLAIETYNWITTGGKSLAEYPNSEWFMDVDVWRNAGHIKEAPPWRVFPKVQDAYPAVNQGENEFYMSLWAEWFNLLSDSEKDAYLSEYGAPPVWVARFSSQGPWNRHLKAGIPSKV